MSKVGAAGNSIFVSLNKFYLQHAIFYWNSPDGGAPKPNVSRMVPSMSPKFSSICASSAMSFM